MGICQSCCGTSSDASGEEDAYGDRSRLVVNGDSYAEGQEASRGNGNTHVSHGGFNTEETFGSLPNGGDNFYSHSKGASVPKSHFDENQAALQDILNKMANDVIDIGVHEVTLEPSDLDERARVYGSKLKSAAHSLALKYEERADEDGLVEAKTGHDHSDHSGVLDEAEAVLISEISARVQGSTSNLEFEFQNASDIIAHFGDTHNASSTEDSFSSPILRGPNQMPNGSANSPSSSVGSAESK